MSPDVQRIAEALGKPTKIASGWKCACPCHDDARASLTLREVGGRLLWHCHAGCEQEAVGDALRGRGLLNGFDPKPAARMRSLSRSSFHLAGLGEPSAVWTYRSPEGVELLVVARYEGSDGKSIRPWRPKASGGWELGALPEPRPLYGTDLLARHPDHPVVVVEGEKCADAARELVGSQFVCTTWPGGAAAVAKADWSALRGRHVTIWPDADDPGRKAAKEIVSRLSGIALSVHVVEPGDRPKGWDCADAQTEGWTGSDVVELLAGAGEAEATTTPPDHDDAPEGPAEGTASESDPLAKRTAELLALAYDFRDARPTLDLPYIVKGVIGAGQLGVFWGRPGSGKSFVAMELCACVAAGVDWHGRRTKRTPVVYVAAESAKVYIDNRITALREHRPELADAEIIVLPVALDLLHSGVGDVDALIGVIRAKGAGLVVVDTLSVTFGGGDENSSPDMGAYMSSIQRIRTETEAAVLLLHHCGKDEARGMRGHSSLFGALDAELMIEGESDQPRTLKTGKVREGDAYVTLFGFDLQRVELGEDADGDPVSTCIVVNAGPPAQTKAKRRSVLCGTGRAALQALHDAITEHGQTMPGSSTIPSGVWAVTLDQWRERFLLRSGEKGSSEKVQGQAFRRGRDALLQAERIMISSPYVWSLDR
jgi:hypothetical protein